MKKQRRPNRDKKKPKKSDRRKPKNQSSSKSLVGRIQKNRMGFGFILPQDKTQPDVYVHASDATELLDDDVVEYRVHQNPKGPIGEILRIIRRAQKEMLGRVQHFGKRTFLHTKDGQNHPLTKADDVPSGEWALAKIESYPSAETPTLLSVKRVLGEALTPKDDVAITMSRFDIPAEFPARALQEAADHASWETKTNLSERKDLKDLPLVTIDGPDAKDFDDAVYAQKIEGGYKLFVAIADVSHFVSPGSALDEEAQRRATSVYFPGTCIPMLPEEISNNICSLRPKENRLAFVAEMKFDLEGRRTDYDFYEAIICTHARLTYEQVQDFFDQKPKTKHELKALAPALTDLRKLYLRLKHQRHDRGVLDFKISERKITVDEEGTPIDCGLASLWDSNQVIEECMIAANSAVAEACRERQAPALYRVHEPPMPGALANITNLCSTLRINRKIKDLTPRKLSQLLRDTADLPQGPTLHQAILRMMKQAYYGPIPLGHFGLALKDYAHFTSPIRRYPDLQVHRALKSLLQNHAKKSDTKKRPVVDLDALGQNCSDLERRAMEAERFINKRKQCWYMLARLGEAFEGKVAGVTANGLFVEMAPSCIEGFVSIDDLEGNLKYDPDHLCLEANRGQIRWTMGAPLNVQVAHVDMEEHKINLVPLKP